MGKLSNVQVKRSSCCVSASCFRLCALRKVVLHENIRPLTRVMSYLMCMEGTTARVSG